MRLAYLRYKPTITWRVPFVSSIFYDYLLAGRKFEDLLILCVTFLKKLCTVGENKDAIKELGVMDLLVKFVPCSSQPLITITLRLLFNLSFDKV